MTSPKRHDRSGVWAVVVAAGSGRRFGAAKQFCELAGARVVDHAVRACRPHVEGVVVVVPADAETDVDHSGWGQPVSVVTGGPTRSSSVRRGLEVVPLDASVVVVHDGARPATTEAVFRAVIDAVVDGADAAVPGVAVTDSLRRVEGGSVDRESLVAVQTPQAFSAHALRAAHECEPDNTDDASVVEQWGGTVRVVAGDPENLKITTRSDLVAADAILGSRLASASRGDLT